MHLPFKRSSNTGINLRLSQLVPVYPAGQVHLYPFISSLHVPLFLQGLVSHSSTSEK